jgi:hypothetical protein
LSRSLARSRGIPDTIGSSVILIATLVAALQIASHPVDSASARPITQLVHSTWTSKVGGGPIGIRGLAQTSDGYI